MAASVDLQQAKAEIEQHFVEQQRKLYHMQAKRMS